MVDDPAVRSVRVAVALCDRFAELMKGPTQVDRSRRGYAAFGVSGDDDGLSMRIGEAQQTYPEIWHHLDDARKGFAARGVAVTDFDHIRASEGPSLGAKVEVKEHATGFGQYRREGSLKTAEFNAQGLARARTAIQSLMTATPEINWAGIAHAEANDPAVLAFNRSARNTKVFWIGLVLFVVVVGIYYLVSLTHRPPH